MSNSTQRTTVAFAYDAWGRMVTKTQGSHLAEYRYRFGDKMSRIDSNFPDEAAYAILMYDGLGKRRYKYVDGSPNSTTYWWRWGRGWNPINEYTDVESTWDWDPEYLTSTYVGSIAEIAGADPSSGTYRYYLKDNLGSVRRVRAHDKSSLAEYEYTPYGGVYSQSGLAINRGFTGHKWDSEIAMYWAPYRHYLPNQARWLTRDPLGAADGPNVYGYVKNRPIGLRDVLGLQGWGCYGPPWACHGPHDDGDDDGGEEDLPEDNIIHLPPREQPSDVKKAACVIVCVVVAAGAVVCAPAEVGACAVVGGILVCVMPEPPEDPESPGS